MILLIDNYDSFTFNLYQYLSEYDEVVVKRNDEITVADIVELKPTQIVISPGPKTPNEAGICVDVIKEYYQSIPILGVCLGHQCIGQAFGATVGKAKEIVHGKSSMIETNSSGLYEELPSEIQVARYHSLAILEDTIPEIIEVTSRTDDKEIMSIKIKDYPTYGLQYHPESINTPEGKKIIENFLKEA